MLEIHVGATNRGTFLTHLVGQDVWLDPKALRPEEKAYFDAEVDCGLARYVHLLPSFSPTINTERLTLTFQPAPRALAGHSLTVVEPLEPSAATTPLFSVDYAAGMSGNLSTSPSFRGAVRAHYVNGPWSASVGTAADVTASRIRWVPSAQVGLNVSATSSVQLAYNVGYTGDVSYAASTAFSSLNAFLFTGARLQLSNMPLQVWPALTIDLPFQAHLRVRVDGLLIAEYDVMAGPVTLRDLPLHNNQGRIEVEIRDETGTRTVVQDYLFPGKPPGSYELSLDAGFLNTTPYLGTRGRYSLSPLVNVEGTGRVIGTAFQAQVRTVISPNPTRSFSVGMAYDSQQNQPFSVVGSAWLLAAPFTVTASAAVPANDVTQTRFATSLAYRAQNYDVQWGISMIGGPSNLTSTLQGNLRVLPALTLSPALTVRRDALRVGLSVDYHPDKALTLRSSGSISSGGATGSLTAQYQLNPTTQLSVSAKTGGASLNLHYADKVKVDASLSTDGWGNVAVQGTTYLLPSGIQFSQGNLYGAFVILETGLPTLKVFADGQFKGVTDASGRLIFSVTSSRAVTIRIDADTLPFDVTLKSDAERLNFPSPGSYRLDWRSKFVRSRFVTFRWADKSLAVNAEIRFENAEINYTDSLGTGFLLVSLYDRQAIMVSQDGKRRCSLIVAANTEVATCAPNPS
ncbi:hypothetical protein EHF33_13785 [Deinococcus psychrotolerans]|uniref:Fimbrial biogenesis outer membrane usher protein n=1 Tax=Deinococcus psychrotolerans TaxID=2489213 RepID=A0A3G8YN07_9DEIO|nr:hypothetical protein [Deinococcus psychrotolerans]AZI43994.1 hypothetical protein EHF33_13785 [Deinococcus psychrotolerans]